MLMKSKSVIYLLLLSLLVTLLITGCKAKTEVGPVEPQVLGIL